MPSFDVRDRKSLQKTAAAAYLIVLPSHRFTSHALKVFVCLALCCFSFGSVGILVALVFEGAVRFVTPFAYNNSATTSPRH